MTLEPIRVEDLKHGDWYYGVQCDCGRQLALHKDLFLGRGDEVFHLPEEAVVTCHCGSHLTTRRLEKYKHPRRSP